MAHFILIYTFYFIIRWCILFSPALRVFCTDGGAGLGATFTARFYPVRWAQWPDTEPSPLSRQNSQRRHVEVHSRSPGLPGGRDKSVSPEEPSGSFLLAAGYNNSHLATAAPVAAGLLRIGLSVLLNAMGLFRSEINNTIFKLLYYQGCLPCQFV